MHEIFQGQTGTHGALDFIYIFQGTLQPVKLTRNPQETQRLRLWGCPRNCGSTWLQSLSCWWAQCFFGMISWKWVTERMLAFWFGVMAFMIDTGWVENCGLLAPAVLVFELVLCLWPSAICALTVVASLAYSIAGWQQWQHVSLPLRVSLCWLTTLFMGSMPRVLCRCLYIIWALLWRQQQQPLLTDVLPYPHPCGDIVFPLIDLELDEGQALLLTLSDTPTYISCLWPCVRDRST